MAKIKIAITMDEELLRNVDEYADEIYTSRSGLITQAVREFMNSHMLVSALTSLSISMRKVAEKGEIDGEAEAKLRDLEALVKALAGYKE